ncbi:MAG TPA: ABC-F family ATP-binding cassette domain-containing protein [Cytophagales bacterium]|nr:ABC-F family ATP-binding cassette domain-containing protein [Cytophagales bacterium]
MNYLSVESLSKTLGDKVLLKNLSFGIERGQKVALVGRNGAGKSTLLKIITGEVLPDNGIVSLRKGISMRFLSQNPYLGVEMTVTEAIFSDKNPITAAIKFYEEALVKAEKGEDTGALQKAMESMDALNAWDYEVKVKEILGKLGIVNLEQKINELSGGQKKRVALAGILIENPDFIIMDEPTNHLDIDMIEWLESFLKTQNQTLLLVTHDRYFLDSVTNQIIELDQGQLFNYNGNYSYFLEKKAEREAQKNTEIDKARNLMKKELEWIRRQPKARGTKAKYRVEAFEDIKEKASQKIEKSQVEFNVKTTRLGSKILEMENVSKRFSDRELIRNFSYVFKKQDRIGIVGKNGTGKSTFLNMITGLLFPDGGKIVKGETTVFGYYGQEEMRFKDDQRVIDIVKDIADFIELGDGSVITASQFLQHFQFSPPAQYDFASKLSGGEKRRLQLLLVLIKNPNFLILDEPTNDLDINTLNVLEDFLMNFKGCLVLVSHDRYFMDRLVDHLFVFEGEGKIKDFPGNYTDYREYLEDVDVQEKVEPKQEKKETSNQTTYTDPDKKKASFQERQEFEKLEKELEKLEEEKRDLVEKLNIGSPNHEELTEWAKKIAEIDKQLEAKTNRWLELSEIV